MYGLIAGDSAWAEEQYPETEDPVDEEAGEWVTCPECGSENAGIRFWGEGVDMDFKCTDCGAHKGVR